MFKPRSPAVLFFHQDPVSDFNERDTGLSLGSFKRLHDWQIKQTRRKIPNRLSVFEPVRQVDGSFGERLATEMLKLWNLGFRKVIVIGRDCPLLQTSDIESAIVAMEQDKVCLGPDLRGGFYLLATSIDPDKISDIQNLPWRGANLLEKIADLAGKEVCFLQPKSDLNHQREIDHLPAALSRQLSILLFGQKIYTSFKGCYLPVFRPFKRQFARPPPLLVF